MSVSATQTQLQSLTPAYLSELAQIALGDAAARVGGWHYESVYGGFGGAIGGTAIYRFRLRTVNNLPCSLILKILYPRPQEVETSPYYWKREYEIYRTGLLDELPRDAFATPRIYGCEDQGDACWIWMEDIHDDKGEWTSADFRDIGARLGRFNGAWLGERSLPDAPWLTRNWHTAIVPALADTFEALDELLAHPLARMALPIDARDEINAIWQEREIYRRALVELPQTFCHIDAFRRNILHRGDDTVLIDWAMAGSGALGVDLVALVAVSLFYDRFSEDYAEQLDKAVFKAYATGLRQAGWQGDVNLARLGYTCGMVLRGLAGVKQDIGFLLDEAHHEMLFESHGTRSLEAVARFFAEVRRFRVLQMAREAKALLRAAP